MCVYAYPTAETAPQPPNRCSESPSVQESPSCFGGLLSKDPNYIDTVHESYAKSYTSGRSAECEVSHCALFSCVLCFHVVVTCYCSKSGMRLHQSQALHTRADLTLCVLAFDIA